MAENRRWNAAAAVATVAVLLSVTGTTSATETTSSKGRVLFVSHFDVSTEMNIMLEVADGLSRRRYECAFLSWEHFRDKVESRGYEFDAIPYPSETPFLNLTEMILAENEWQYLHQFSKLGPILASTYEPAIQPLKESIANQRPDMIVSSMFGAAAIDLATLNDIPLSITFACPLGHLFFYEDIAAAPDSFLWGRLENSARFGARMQKLARNVMVIAGDTSGSIMNAARERNGIPTYNDPLANWGKASIIVPATFSLDVARRLRPLTHMVGLIVSMPPIDSYTSTADTELMSWMDSRTGGVVYAAFGSIAIPLQPDLDALVAAMGAWIDRNGGPAKAGAIVVLKEGHGRDLSNVPPSVTISGWTNQKLILSHPNTQVFVTHGGQGSYSEAIYAGVPMLVLPAFGDQMANAIALEQAGVALQLHRRITPVTMEAVTDRLDSLSTDPSFKPALKRQKLISDLAGGAEKASEVIEHHMLVGVDHLVPVEERVPFLAATNLDVYAVVATGFLLLIWGLVALQRWALEGIYRFTRSSRMEYPSSAPSLQGLAKKKTVSSKEE